MRRAVVLALALALAGCGESKGADCPAACGHLIELSIADVETSGMIDDPDLRSAVKAGLQAPAAPGRDTCVQKCREGKLDARCALAARTLEDAMRCGRAEAPTARP